MDILQIHEPMFIIVLLAEKLSGRQFLHTSNQSPIIKHLFYQNWAASTKRERTWDTFTSEQVDSKALSLHLVTSETRAVIDAIKCYFETDILDASLTRCSKMPFRA